MSMKTAVLGAQELTHKAVMYGSLQRFSFITNVNEQIILSGWLSYMCCGVQWVLQLVVSQRNTAAERVVFFYYESR